VEAILETDQVRERVGKRVDQFLSSARPQLDDISPDVGALIDTVHDFMDGGKRLRALFLYWGWRAAGGQDNEVIISAAASMEFVQACALIHDDVMDCSDSRRGRPAVHRQFAQQHAAAEWAGASHDYGNAAAILIGDLCLSWADALLMDSGLSHEQLRRGKPVYDSMRVELMAGQYLDILEQARRSSTVEAALRVATYKSAKYTIERPLHLGASLADANRNTIEGLRSYGLALGQAFQLRDDLLGMFGDSSQTGKPTGDDLREGKRTALLALALQQTDQPSRSRIETVLGDRFAPDAAIAEATELISATGARSTIEEMITAASKNAEQSLTGITIDPTAQRVLLGLVQAATVRSA